MTSTIIPGPAHGTCDPGPRDYSRIRVWAPDLDELGIAVGPPGAGPSDLQEHRARPEGEGWFALDDAGISVGDRYLMRPGPARADEMWVPDPRSLLQPDGVHGVSEVVDPRALTAADRASWQGRDLRGRVIYELHVGTFAPGSDGTAGTFDTAIGRLDDVVALGVDAVEVMPVAAFPGERGWGYDGVDLYATQASDGGPEAFARFIAAAHERGLAVILDVVYNHLGPAGNYLALFGPYFTATHHTPWGEAVNLDAPGSEGVRAFILGNARQWLVDFGLDGLRLDAVHALRDDSERHLLAELSDAVHTWAAELGRPLTLIAESDLNDVRMVTPTAAGGYGMDMQWADDIHHAVHAWVTGEREGYYSDFGTGRVLAKTLTRIFEHDGSFSTFRDRDWGAPVDPASDLYDAHSFVAFDQDHDQVGNRAIGDRVHHTISAGQQAAAIALILCGPATPMLFEGEEWSASAPFPFFTDHDAELGPLVSAGRAAEFAKMDWAQEVPDPQSEQTFRSGMLDWAERTEGEHARMLDWYTRLIALRRTEPDLMNPDLRATTVQMHGEETAVMTRGAITVIAHRGQGAVPIDGSLGRDVAAYGAVSDGPTLTLQGPGAVVLRREG